MADGARRVPRLLAILALGDGTALAARDPLLWFGQLAAAGVDGLQVRAKELNDRELYDLATAARAALPPPARVVANGRADVALAAGLDGVHLPADGVPVAALRRRFGAELLVGRSTHTLDEVATAAAAGADYVVFGPVFPTPGKGPSVGIAALRRAAAQGVPVLALGGVTVERLAEVAAAGAAGAAGIRLFLDPDRLRQAVEIAAHCFCQP